MTRDYEIVGCVKAPGYRYRLDVRTRAQGRRLLVIQLNPSVADTSRSDPTVGKVSLWAASNEFRSVVFANLFGKCTPHPEELQGPLPILVGPDNDRHLRAVLHEVDTIVCAWGNIPCHLRPHYDERLLAVQAIARNRQLHIVGTLTRKGFPRHGRTWNLRNRTLTPWVAAWSG